MTVSEAYKEYIIPRNLGEHMLRVAALARIITDNWNGSKLEAIDIVKACALHDLAKPMTFDLAKQAQFGMSQEEIDDLASLQNRLKTSYGENEHHASVKLCQDLGCNQQSVKIADNLEWSYIPQLIERGETESLIAIYSDMRIGPKSILLLLDRLTELKNRTDSKEYNQNVVNGTKLEQLIQQNCSLDLTSVTEYQLESLFSELKETVI
jgi:hypothetical protein